MIRLISACFWLPNALKKYELEQREAERLFLEEEEKKKLGVGEKKTETASESEESKSTENKSPENVEKGFIDNEDTGDDDTTKKNK